MFRRYSERQISDVESTSANLPNFSFCVLNLQGIFFKVRNLTVFWYWSDSSTESKVVVREDLVRLAHRIGNTFPPPYFFA
jgi:hypothetical protein